MKPPLEYRSPLALPFEGDRDWGVTIVATTLALGVIVLPAIYLTLASLGTHLVPILLGVVSVVLALGFLTIGSALSGRRG